MFDILGLGGPFSGIATNPLDMRAMSDEQIRAMEANMAWAFANAKPSWVGLENFRPRWQGPPAPQGWADWFAVGDALV